MQYILKLSVIVLVFSLVFIRSTPSYADHVRVGVDIRVPVSGYYGDPYYYGNPYYADPYYPRYVVASPSSSYQPVVINGVTYYLNNGTYYLYTQYGYQAVAPPVVVAQPVSASISTPIRVDVDGVYTVNVPNDKGGYNAVILKQSGKGFVGPQGEFYDEFPKISQLKLMYGK